ncbi:MAG: methyltransferase domain-containing protein [Bacteroidetes bacterium]|nr:methyltransferase domain-containing protein [Bacteroidota bacterium]
MAQASVYELPYTNNLFDIVVCLGVIQHTPDPEKQFVVFGKKSNPEDYWLLIITSGELVITLH